jgi:DNA-directed RNA polymerase subunit RPC12/RpoP
MANFYCKHCGHKAPSIQVLTGQPCPKHPLGSNKGRHELYEGAEKSKYSCKYCGHSAPSIQVLVGQPCPKHPDGNN